MDSEEGPTALGRTNSFPQDRAYPSHSTRTQIPKQLTGESMVHDRRYLHHQGTGDIEPRRRLRYTIPLHRKTKPPGDEENGHLEEKAYNFGYSAASGIDRETSRSSAAFPSHEYLEIISTKWVPDDEGRKIVTLTVKDEGGRPDQAKVCCESRWKHIKSDALSLKQFEDQVMSTPGLGNDDMALVGRLLNRVRNTSEKQFVHGRYLKPITLVYEGEDPDVPSSDRPEERHARKTATFVSLPIFTTCCPKHHTSTKEFEGHPVRALLQSRYRLESTKRRDNEQVITKARSIKQRLAHKEHVIHVPHIWILIINNSTIISCAALDASVLRSDTIKLITYAAAQLDEATWSMHFTDAQGKDFYLPLRTCKTWFDLVRQITDNCLDDEYNFIRDELLKGGPVHKLVVAKDGSPVNAENWPNLVEEKRTEVIHLRLVDNETRPSRLFFTYCDDEGNEINMESDTSNTTSPSFSSDEGEDSDESESLPSVGTPTDDIALVVDRLRNLRAKLRQAEDREDAKKIEILREHKIPALEENILELLDAPRTQHTRAPRIIIPGPYDAWPRHSHDVDNESPLSPTKRQRERLGSRSRSTSRSRLVTRGALFTHHTNNLSLEEVSARGRAMRPWITHDRNHSGSRNRYFRDIKYDIPSRVGYGTRSHMPSANSLSRVSTLPTQTRSGWDLLRSRVRDGQVPGLRGSPMSPISPLTPGNDIYYHPSDKQLARSYWDLVRSTVLEGGIQKLRDAEVAMKDDKHTYPIKASVASVDEKEERRSCASTDLSNTRGGTHDGSMLSPPATSGPSEALHSVTSGVTSVSNGEIDSAKPKKVLFSEHNLESKSKLKRVIKLARKGSVVSPAISTSQTALEVASPVAADPMMDLPIFLWSAHHKQFESRDVAGKIPQLPSISEASTFKSFFQKPAEEIKRMINTSKTEELILRTVMTEAHGTLKRPKKEKAQYAVLYEKTTDKNYADVANFINKLKGNKENMSEMANVAERNSTKPASQLRRASLALAGASLLRKSSNRSFADMSGQDDLGSVKLGIFDLASKILFAFVPKECDAHVIFKYWGALYKLLNEKDEKVLLYVRSRLSEVCALVKSIQMGVRAEDGSKHQRYEIPQALPAAFQHLVLLLVVISNTSNWSAYSWSQMQSSFDDCEGNLVKGRKQLLLMIHTDDYRDSLGFQAVDSEALVSLILANLIPSVSTGGDFDLTDVYAEYTTEIQSVVRDSASVKVYDEIKFLREEIDIIKDNLRQQFDTLREFKSTIAYTYGVGSLSISVLDRVLGSVSQRIEDFDELQAQAETARFLAAQSISLKAESNNKAIIVFTVVTIVFLPLSFVTSYLGMNTSDLRNMKSGQTLFWEIGTPVAFVVLGTALVAAFYGTMTQRFLGRQWREKEKGE